jgi:hypothetical protein
VLPQLCGIPQTFFDTALRAGFFVAFFTTFFAVFFVGIVTPLTRDTDTRVTASDYR